jgi:Mn2+/Fe2+ NRAMP family transporter
VIALIGTTVVPYNLFLHASSVSKKWKKPEHLKDAKKDLLISIPLGGLISLAIMSTAAMAFFGQSVELKSAADIAPALQPLFGDKAEVLMAIGLFSAGISSSVTAPLAAAYALSGILEKNWNLTDFGFKAVWVTILILGVIPATIGFKPVSIIWFAQVANGIMLPLITGFLLYLMNSHTLGDHKNSKLQNLLGGGIFIVTLILSARSLSYAFNVI